ncbi:putative zinc finger, CCHC-type containing protein [Tanacetum coccineum]
MSQRFYYLNGVDDVNLKQVFLNSFPESLGNEAYRALEARNKRFLAEFERTGKRLGTACDDKYLQIKCKDKSSCDCTHTKKKFHSKRFSSLSGKPWFSRRSSKKWKFIRKKKQRGRTSDRCFICQKRGHFARNCPDKKRSQALIQALNQVEPVDVSDLESLYSLDDEPSDSVLCTIAYSNFSSDDDSDTDSLESDSDFGVHMINPIPHVLPIQEASHASSIPHTPKVHLPFGCIRQDYSVYCILCYFSINSTYIIPNEILVSALGMMLGLLSSLISYLVLAVRIPHSGRQDKLKASESQSVPEQKKDASIKIHCLSENSICRTDASDVVFSFLPPRAVNDDESVMYHAPYCFIHEWYKVNPSSRRCERKLRTFYADTRSLMARANGIDPDKIPYYVMWNISVWSKDHPDAYKWIEANGQWLYDNFDHCDVETSDDDDDARSLWSSDDDEHFDPFEDDPTHPDARWSP